MSVATFPFTRETSLLLNAVALACYSLRDDYSKTSATHCHRVLLSVSEFSRDICVLNIGREITYIREGFCFIFSVLTLFVFYK